MDIVDGKFEFDVFWDDDVLGNADNSWVVARTVSLLIEGMERIQNIGWFRRNEFELSLVFRERLVVSMLGS